MCDLGYYFMLTERYVYYLHTTTSQHFKLVQQQCYTPKQVVYLSREVATKISFGGVEGKSGPFQLMILFVKLLLEFF